MRLDVADDAYKAHAAQTSEAIAVVRTALSTAITVGSMGGSTSTSGEHSGKNTGYTLDVDKRLANVVVISGNEGVGPIAEKYSK